MNFGITGSLINAHGFSYPVVPEGKARIRVQISAEHTETDLDFAMEQFAAVKDELGI